MIAPATFRSDYVEALSRHVLRADETTLRDGYELGRRAVSESVSALELAAIHHDALGTSLRAVQHEQAAEVVAAAASFFQEILSAFEMVHRGYRAAAAAAAEERRGAAMLRRLSSFLADASLSARHTDAATEVLYLVAEHARELTDAAHATARWGAGAESVRATSCDHETPAPPEAELLHLEDVAATLPTRVSRAEWRAEALGAASAAESVLTVPIAALDGRAIGLLQLVGKRGGDFTDADAAVAAHLADMAAAALERAELYRGHHVSL